MPTTISDTRDAIEDARLEVQEAVIQAKLEFYRPDLITGLALQAAMAPDDAWELLSEKDKKDIVEVVNG